MTDWIYVPAGDDAQVEVVLDPPDTDLVGAGIVAHLFNDVNSDPIWIGTVGDGITVLIATGTADTPASYVIILDEALTATLPRTCTLESKVRLADGTTAQTALLGVSASPSNIRDQIPPSV